VKEPTVGRKIKIKRFFNIYCMKIKRFNEISVGQPWDSQAHREFSIDMSVVKAHDSTPNYLSIIRSMIRKGEGKVWVNNIEGNTAHIRSWQFDILGDATVPVEALKGFSMKSWTTNNVAKKFDM